LKKIVEMRRNCNLWILPEEGELLGIEVELRKESISIIFYYFQHDRFWDFNHEFLLLTEIKITLRKCALLSLSFSIEHILALGGIVGKCRYDQGCKN
jgi:hypothetical protein